MNQRRPRVSEIIGRLGDGRTRDLLPELDAPYDSEKLTEEEFAALEEALGDGFGELTGRFNKPRPLPVGISSGLMRHAYWTTPDSDYLPDYDEEEDEGPGEFWTEGWDEIAPSKTFPLHFIINRLRLYFQNQFERFCSHLKNKHVEYSDLDLIEDEDIFADVAIDQFYLKPWYEVHALQFMDLMETAPHLVLSTYSGSLGRLVEQYYWRFRYEPAVRSGLGARTGASAGGKARAQLSLRVQAAWQRAAESIWERNPGLSNTAVADLVKRQLKEPKTAKHIARYIRRPVEK